VAATAFEVGVYDLGTGAVNPRARHLYAPEVRDVIQIGAVRWEARSDGLSRRAEDGERLVSGDDVGWVFSVDAGVATVAADWAASRLTARAFDPSGAERGPPLVLPGRSGGPAFRVGPSLLALPTNRTPCPRPGDGAGGLPASDYPPCADPTGDVYVVDVSGAPRLTSTVKLGTPAPDRWVQDPEGVLYASYLDGDQRQRPYLDRLDLRAAPLVDKHVSVPGLLLAARGDLLFTAAMERAVPVVSACRRLPGAQRAAVISRLELPPQIHGGAADQQHAIFLRGSELLVVDLSDPEHLKLAPSVTLPRDPVFGVEHEVQKIAAGHAFVSTALATFVIDLRTTPTLREVLSIPTAVASAHPLDGGGDDGLLVVLGRLGIRELR
jgi:hypothetical protein